MTKNKTVLLSVAAISASLMLLATTAMAQMSMSPSEVPPNTVSAPAKAEAAATPAPAAVQQAAPSTQPASTATQPAAAAPAGGLVFEDALSQTYTGNPDLKAARAQLRSVDETYAQAMSGYRPYVSGNAGIAYTDEDGTVNDSNADSKTLSLGVTQPLYHGGSTEANVDNADNRVKAQRSVLKITEQNVLLSAITAYMDVIRDQQIVELNNNNEKVLNKQLDASKQRFELGDITKTDVSQADSRLAAATADRVRAEGNYRASRAIFEKLIGASADGLQKPTGDIMVPVSLDVAINDASKNNPNISYAAFNSEAAEASTRSIKGELLPQVDLTGSLGRTYDPVQRVDSHVDDSSIGVRATIPLYTAGSTDARVRQARQVEQQRHEEIKSAERSVRQMVVDSWTALESSKAEMDARSAQIKAAQLALDGVKVESDYGSRTTLDLLDAEQEFLNAQVAYVIAERDKIVAAYSLLAAVGDLTAETLHLQAPVYNPEAHFQKVKNQWIGTGISSQ